MTKDEFYDWYFDRIPESTCSKIREHIDKIVSKEILQHNGIDNWLEDIIRDTNDTK